MTLNVGDRIRILTPRVGQWFRIESLSDYFVDVESGLLTRRLVEQGIEAGTIDHASNGGAKVYADLDEAKAAMGEGEVVVRLAPLARWIVVSEGQFEASADTCGWVLEAETSAASCVQCAHSATAHRLYDEPGDDEQWSWCDECGGRCEFVAAPEASHQTPSFILAAAAQAMFDMGFGRLVMRETAS